MIGGRYQLRTAIGHGGMGTVWQASDTLLRRDVAVKEVLLPPSMAASDRDAMCERTLREARAAAALSHPSVVQVYDVVTEAGRPWIVMELLHARSLADMIISDGPLAPRAVAKIGVALLGALEVAHAAGVLHRDVKPANILICTDGRCVLTDFGVARMPAESNLTTPGMVLGSPHFISPERAVGGTFGPPSDLFSLGVSLYTAVEGRPPFDKGDPFETMRAVVEEEPAAMHRAGPLMPVLDGLLEKDPLRRWDVTEARSALRDLLSGPLAVRTAQHVTDPYAVMPSPPPPIWAPNKPAPQQVNRSGQIGGRAMLGPGESLEDRLTTADRGGPASHAAASLPPTGEQPGLGDPAGPPHGQGWFGPPGAGPGYPGDPRHGANPYPPSFPPATYKAGGPIGGTLRSGAQGMVGTLKRWPRWAQIGLPVGCVVLLVVVLVIVATAGRPSPASQIAAPPTPSASPTPLIPIQSFEDPHGIKVNVPLGWKQQAASSYVDFVEPGETGRRVRINVESRFTSAQQFFTSAENYLKGHCGSPFQRLDLHDITLAGQPAAQYEYVCGAGDQARHGLWAAVVVDGKAYECYLMVPDSKFEESKPIFAELVRSFALTVHSSSSPSGP